MSAVSPRTPLETVIDALAARGQKPRGNDKGWTALCPAHEDRTPSLSVGTGNNGDAVIHCHAGCHTNDILAALGLNLRDLFDTPKANGSDDFTAIYDYVDELGNLLFQVVRKPGKQFRQRRPDGAGGWVWKLGDTRRVLYRLPEVLEAVAEWTPVFVVEGEKDADRLAAEGYVATTNPHGAGKWRSDYNATLTGADVIIVADRDEPGLAHAREVARHLAGIATSVKVVGAAVGRDVSDHLAAGRPVDDLEPIDLDNEKVADDPIRVMFVNWPDFFTKDRDDGDDWAIDDVLARGRGHSIFAKGKTGKSELVLRLVVDHVTDPDNTDVAIVLDYEMGEADLYQRLVDDFGYDQHTDFTRLRYAQLPTIPPLDTSGGADTIDGILTWVEAQHPGSHVIVVIDTIGRAVEGPENENDTILRFYRNTGAVLRRHETTWARLDHTGHENSDRARGGSAKLDDIDIAWELKRTDDGTELVRRASRLSWVPERVAFVRSTEPTVNYTRCAEAWPDGTAAVARKLDELGVPLKAGRPTAGKALREDGWKGRNEVVGAALRYRKSELYVARELSRTARNLSPGTVNGDSGDTTPLTSGDSYGDSRGQVPADGGDRCVPLEGGHLPRPSPNNNLQPPERTFDGLDPRIDTTDW